MEKLTEEQLSTQVNEQFLFSKRYLDPIHERMNAQEELYRTYIDAADYPHTARVFDPRIFRIIETITPRMVANEPEGSFYPVEDGDMQNAEILNALIKYDWRRADMFKKEVDFVKCMLIFGTAFGRTYWDFRETTKHRMVPAEVDGKMIWAATNTEEIQVTEYDGPNFEALNIYDCFPDPNATGIENMRWFIYRTFRTLDELKAENDLRGKAYYKNLDKLEEAINATKDKNQSSNSSSNPSYMTYREHRRVMLSTQELKGQDTSNPEVVVLRRFTKDTWVDFVPEYNLIIREIDNPYFHGELPIVYAVDYAYPGELYGMGEIEPVDRIQRAINAVLNQRLDNVQLTLRTMWKVRKNTVALHQLVSAPGNVIEVDSMDDVEALQTPDVTGSTFVQTMDYLTSAMQNGSGITDYTLGVGNNANVANETATGTRLIQQEANAQFKLKLQLFNHMAITRIVNQWKDLRIQYTTEAQKLRIMGSDQVKYMVEKTNLSKMDMQGNSILPGDFSTPAKMEVGPDQNFAFLNLLPEDIQPSVVGDYDFIPTISAESLTDPIAMQENFFAGLDRITTPEWTQGLITQGKQPNYVYLTEKVFEKLHLGLESKDVITDYQQPLAQPMQPGMEGQPMEPGMSMDEMQTDNMMGEIQPNPFDVLLNQEENNG